MGISALASICVRRALRSCLALSGLFSYYYYDQHLADGLKVMRALELPIERWQPCRYPPLRQGECNPGVPHAR